MDALTFTDRIDGTVGVPDLVAVCSRGNSARVLRYSGATTLAPLPVAPDGGTTTSVGGIRAWFPGYKTGYLAFNNDTRATPRSSSTSPPGPTPPTAAGSPRTSKTASPAAPDHSGDPRPGRLHAVLLIATLTAGEGGDCAATDFTGQWAAYVVVTPLDRPADRTVAKLVWSRSGQLTVQSVGGSLDLQSNSDTVSVKPLGVWDISIQSPPPPGAPASLKVTGTRLDPAGTDRPVYRFDVPATTWPLPVSTPPRIQTVLPPLEVHGHHCHRRRRLPRPARPAGTTDPGHLRVGHLVPGELLLAEPDPIADNRSPTSTSRPGSTSSNRVNLAGLPAPPPGPRSVELVVCPATGSTACDATADPVANGLDQAKLRIQVYDVQQPGAAAHRPGVQPDLLPRRERRPAHRPDPRRRIGLHPGQPLRRRLPQRRLDRPPARPPTNGTVGGRFGYLSTTTTDEQEVTAHVGGSTQASHPIIVDAVDFTPHSATRSPSRPRLLRHRLPRLQRYQLLPPRPGHHHQTRTVPHQRPRHPTADRTAVHSASQTPHHCAQTSLASLPLQQVAGQPEHTVAAAPSTSTTAKSTSTPPPASNPPTPSTPGSSATAPRSQSATSESAAATDPPSGAMAKSSAGLSPRNWRPALLGVVGVGEVRSPHEAICTDAIGEGGDGALSMHRGAADEGGGREQRDALVLQPLANTRADVARDEVRTRSDRTRSVARVICAPSTTTSEPRSGVPITTASRGYRSRHVQRELRRRAGRARAASLLVACRAVGTTVRGPYNDHAPPRDDADGLAGLGFAVDQRARRRGARDASKGKRGMEG